ncbi:MAG: ligase-associated DNA damage response endonuclease PdeM [Cyclobacteriaceae bacterium]|nr:ligase-associated DNA damage response endonuclease PdeM [Cyclobacteriaceae bacterium]
MPGCGNLKQESTNRGKEGGREEFTEIALGNRAVHLLPERAIFLPESDTLVLADLHFGKVNHFRRAGLPVPPAANQRNAERLIDLIQKMKPARTLFLGDLFHSAYNDDWEVVGQIVRHFPACSFVLVIGNHDILSERQYVRNGIQCVDRISEGNVVFTHEPLEAKEVADGTINVAGHLHPAARLTGKGRQSLVMPCFWKSEKHFILPAFGSFTGLAAIAPAETDTVYVLVDHRILEIRPVSMGTKSASS